MCEFHWLGGKPCARARTHDSHSLCHLHVLCPLGPIGRLVLHRPARAHICKQGTIHHMCVGVSMYTHVFLYNRCRVTYLMIGHRLLSVVAVSWRYCDSTLDSVLCPATACASSADSDENLRGPSPAPPCTPVLVLVPAPAPPPAPPPAAAAAEEEKEATLMLVKLQACQTLYKIAIGIVALTRVCCDTALPRSVSKLCKVCCRSMLMATAAATLQTNHTH